MPLDATNAHLIFPKLQEPGAKINIIHIMVATSSLLQMRPQTSVERDFSITNWIKRMVSWFAHELNTMS